jgi:nucleotide-binding universal stress UspA family protein
LVRARPKSGEDDGRTHASASNSANISANIPTMKILLPIDGSPDALDAVRHALRLVQEGLRASFVLINVQSPANLYEVMVAHDPDKIMKLRTEAGAELLQPAEALLSEAGVEWESEVVGGEPGSMLVDQIENYGCDAVVMGSHGAGSLSSALLGSVSGALLRHSPVPVTVVRRSEPATDAQESAEPTDE